MPDNSPFFGSLILFLLLLGLQSTLKAQDDLGLSVSVLGLGSSEEKNAFWSSSNTYGRIGEGTYGVGVLSGIYGHNLDDNWRVWGGASMLFSADRDTGRETETLRLNQYHAGIQWKKLELRAGAWQRPELMMGISGVGGDLLWSNNALSMPGVVFQTAESIPLIGPFSMDAAFGNYWLPKDRVTQNAKVHYKHFILNTRIGQGGTFSFGVHHYAHWGGFNTQGRGQQPEGFSDFLKIVLVHSGGENAFSGDQRNKLGNHIGSHRIGYAQQFEGARLQFYYQSFIEDETGIDGRTFPDGVWGLFFKKPEKGAIQGISYEYYQTDVQGGTVGQNGGNDNYFNNGVYRDGWTYQGYTIGLPFFLTDPEVFGVAVNELKGHHLGVGGSIASLSYSLKTSFITNKGRNRLKAEVPEHVIYSGLEMQYKLGQNSTLELVLGADLSDLNPNRYTAGLGYRYQFRKGCRGYECQDIEQHLR